MENRLTNQRTAIRKKNWETQLNWETQQNDRKKNKNTTKLIQIKKKRWELMDVYSSKSYEPQLIFNAFIYGLCILRA